MGHFHKRFYDDNENYCCVKLSDLNDKIRIIAENIQSAIDEKLHF